MPDGPPLDVGDPTDIDDLAVAAELVPLALRAFDRVLEEEPEYAEMLEDAEFAPALTAIRTALAGQPVGEGGRRGSISRPGCRRTGGWPPSSPGLGFRPGCAGGLGHAPRRSAPRSSTRCRRAASG